MNTNDADWVDDVRRWYFNGGKAASTPSTESTPRVPASDLAELGYEAANPNLESTAWARPAATAFGRLG